MKNKIDEQKFLDLYNQGFTDKIIGEKLGLNKSFIFKYRHKLNLPKHCRSKVDPIKYKELRNKGFSNLKISKILGNSASSLDHFAKKYNYPNLDMSCQITPTKFQMEVIIGTMLGDSSMVNKKDTINASMRMYHCAAQKDYITYKYKILESLCSSEPKYSKSKTPDKRNGNFYERYSVYLNCNKNFNWLYNELYSTGKKIITSNLLEKFTPVSLAFLYMDDGTKMNGSAYSIATMCFDDDSIKLLREKLKSFDIETTIHKNRSVYILSKSGKKFKDLINKYVPESMKYKLY